MDALNLAYAPASPAQQILDYYKQRAEARKQQGAANG